MRAVGAAPMQHIIQRVCGRGECGARHARSPPHPASGRRALAWERLLNRRTGVRFALTSSGCGDVSGAVRGSKPGARSCNSGNPASDDATWAGARGDAHDEARAGVHAHVNADRVSRANAGESGARGGDCCQLPCWHRRRRRIRVRWPLREPPTTLRKPAMQPCST